LRIDNVFEVDADPNPTFYFEADPDLGYGRLPYYCSSFLPVLTAFSPSQHMATTGPWSIYFTNPLKKGLTNRNKFNVND
jgi:hypothetical protein